MGFLMGSSCFLQSPLYQSIVPSSSSSSSSFPTIFLYSNIKNAENKKNKRKNAIFMASLPHENPSESNFCKRRAILFVGISALPFLQLKARAVEGFVKEERDRSMLEERSSPRTEDLQNEKVHQGYAQPNSILTLLNALGILGSGVLGALYMLTQKEKTATEATIESMKTKLSEKEAAMVSLEKNFERKLLHEQEERAKQIGKARVERQSLLNQLTSANSTITGLGKELQSEKRLLEELKSQIDRLQTGLTKAGEDKMMLEEKLKEKLNSIEVLQERINLLSLEIKDKEDTIRNLSSSLAKKELEFKNLNDIYKQAKANLAEANSEIKGLKEEVLKTHKELEWKNFAVDDLNARISSLIAERDDTNRRVNAIQEEYNDLKLSSEQKAASDAELLAKKRHEYHQLEEKLGFALNEASNNQALISGLTQERDDLRTMLEIETINMNNLRNEIQIIKETLESSRVEASDLSKQLEHSRKLCKDLEIEVSRVQAESSKAQESLKRSLDDARSISESLSGELASVKEVLKKTREEVQGLSNELAAAAKTRENLKKELLDIYKKAESATNDLKEERKIVATLNKELEASEKQILKDKEARKTLEIDLEEATKSLDEMNRNALMLSRDLDIANSRISGLEDEKDMLFKSLIEQKKASKEAQENVEDAHNLVMRLGKERDSLEKKAKKLEEEMASAKGEILRLRSKINSSRSPVNDQHKKISEVEGNAAVTVKKSRRRKSEP